MGYGAPAMAMQGFYNQPYPFYGAAFPGGAWGSNYGDLPSHLVSSTRSFRSCLMSLVFSQSLVFSSSLHNLTLVFFFLSGAFPPQQYQAAGRGGGMGQMGQGMQAGLGYGAANATGGYAMDQVILLKRGASHLFSFVVFPRLFLSRSLSLSLSSHLFLISFVFCPLLSLSFHVHPY